MENHKNENVFVDDCLKWTDDNNIFCGYRVTTVTRSDFGRITAQNYTDYYKDNHIINDI